MNGTTVTWIPSSDVWVSFETLSFPLTLYIPPVTKSSQFYHPHISLTYSLLSVPTATACFSSSLSPSWIIETTYFFSLQSDCPGQPPHGYWSDVSKMQIWFLSNSYSKCLSDFSCEFTSLTVAHDPCCHLMT